MKSKLSVSKCLLFDTLSNYAVVLMRLISGVWMVRAYFTTLSLSDYGLWVWLWTFFGYLALLDLGFGPSLERKAAVLHSLSLRISAKRFLVLRAIFIRDLLAVVLYFLFISIFIALCVLVFAYGFDGALLKMMISQNNQEAFYADLFVLFGLLSIFIFPTGLFLEVLKGFRQIFIRNVCIFFSTLFHLLLSLYWLKNYENPLVGLTFIQIGIQGTTQIFVGFFVWQRLKNLTSTEKENCSIERGVFFPLRFSLVALPKLFFRLKLMRGFSFSAYFVLLSSIIVFKFDALIISIFISLKEVSFYQIASRPAFIFDLFVNQFQESFTALASKWHSEKDSDRLLLLFTLGNRLVAFLALPSFFFLSLIMEPLLFFWVGVQSKETVVSAIVLLAAFCTVALFRSVTAKILIMSGHHKWMGRIAIFEAALKLITSVIFALVWGFVGVVCATLLCSVIFSLFFILPKSCHHFAQSVPRFLWQNLSVPFFSAALASFFLYAYVHFNIVNQWYFYDFALVAFLYSALYLMGCYLFSSSHDRHFVKIHLVDRVRVNFFSS